MTPKKNERNESKHAIGVIDEIGEMRPEHLTDPGWFGRALQREGQRFIDAAKKVNREPA